MAALGKQIYLANWQLWVRNGLPKTAYLLVIDDRSGAGSRPWPQLFATAQGRVLQHHERLLAGSETCD